MKGGLSCIADIEDIHVLEKDVGDKIELGEVHHSL